MVQNPHQTGGIAPLEAHGRARPTSRAPPNGRIALHEAPGAACLPMTPPANGGNCAIRAATRRRHAEERLLMVQNPHVSLKCTAGMEGVGGTGSRGQASRHGPDRGARWAAVAWPEGDAPQRERHANWQATLQSDIQRSDTPTRSVLCPQFRMQSPRDLCAAQNCIVGIATFSRYVESSVNRIACENVSVAPEHRARGPDNVCLDPLICTWAR